MTPAEEKEPEQRRIAAILDGLASAHPLAAWSDFLRGYSPLILQVVRLFEREDDPMADCFVFVCEQLHRNRYQRLRRFHPEGPASFATWLRAVARNLCLDWRRSEMGRLRVFRSVARLSAVDQHIFQHHFEQGRTVEETFLLVRSRFPGLTAGELSEGLERIHQSLSPRQRWLLSMRGVRVELLEGGQDGTPDRLERFRDTMPDPEALAAERQRHETLAKAMGRLPKPERLLLRLRYEQDLTLEQIARLTGLRDGQTADRRIREILARVRQELEGGGKAPSLSV